MRERGSRLLLAALGCCAAAALLLPESALGIPAFARREGVQCTMCHFRLPELNEDGHAYIRRGLREEPPERGEAKVPAERKQPLGEPLRLDWADEMTVMGHHEFVVRRGAKPAFDAGLVDLWFGGPLSPHWSGLANPAADIDEGGVDVEQAYGQVITKWGERFFSARAGQLLPFAVLFNQGGPTMTLSTPVALSAPAATGNPWAPSTLTKGVEVGYVDLRRWNVYAGVGQPHLEADATSLAPEAPPNVEVASGEAGAHADIFASAEYLFTERGDAVTAYAYSGEAMLPPDGRERSFHRIGIFGTLYGPMTKGTAAYLGGSDDAISGRSLDNSGFFVLVEQLLTHRWAAYARYDWFRRDLENGADQTVNGPALGASWWVQTQVRLTVEGQLLDDTAGSDMRRLVAELMWAL